MHCLDASAVIDYLHGQPGMGAFVEAHETEPLFAPTVALHEAYVGAVRMRGMRGLQAVREDLDWLERIPLSEAGAAEAAAVDGELHDAGAPIGALDTLIAGVVRNAGGTVVTNDGDFERVNGLDVFRYDT